ncbi:MAG: tripartite tricarboxylate transporter TctB family protein, partial [Burkholderiales bacterium]
GGIMMTLGAIIALRATRVAGTGIGPWGWRPLLVLGLAFVVYGLAMETFELGFVPSLVAVIVLSSFAGREFRTVELVLLTVVLVVGAVGLFIYGLELPYPLFWWR